MGMLDKYRKSNYQSGGNSAKVIAENKEYVKTSNDQIIRIENAPTHNDNIIVTEIGNRKVKSGKGGIMLNNVKSVLSATHENRNSKDKLYTYKDEEIKIMPKEAKIISEALNLPIKLQKKGISPSKLLNELIEKRETTINKYKNINKPQRHSESRFNSIKSNKAILAAIPDVEKLYDTVFNYSESKKTENQNSEYAQVGKDDTEHYEDYAQTGMAKRMYKTVAPGSYWDTDNWSRLITGRDRLKDKALDDVRSEEFYRNYLGIKGENKYLSPSPIKGYKYKVDRRLENDLYNSLKDKVTNEFVEFNETDVQSDFSDSPLPKDDLGNPILYKTSSLFNDLPRSPAMASRARALGHFNARKGKDEKGEFFEYNDTWKLQPAGISIDKLVGGTPYTIGNKIYKSALTNQKQTGGKLSKYYK